MPLEPQDLEPFVVRKGPVHVVDQDGAAVSYATSARLDMIDSDRAEAWTVADVQLTLLDEQSRPTRALRGRHIVEVRPDAVGYTVVVTDEEGPDPGVAVKTRGT